MYVILRENFFLEMQNNQYNFLNLRDPYNFWLKDDGEKKCHWNYFQIICAPSELLARLFG